MEDNQNPAPSQDPNTPPQHDPSLVNPKPAPAKPKLLGWFSKRKVLALGGLVVVVGLVIALGVHKHTAPAVISSQVSINTQGFYPKEILVHKGQTVTWINYDSAPHWVASDPYPKNDALASLSSDSLNPHDSYSYTFEKLGTFTYHDNLNPYKLLGTVVVQ